MLHDFINVIPRAKSLGLIFVQELEDNVYKVIRILYFVLLLVREDDFFSLDVID
jgi:hypothetical protein